MIKKFVNYFSRFKINLIKLLLNFYKQVCLGVGKCKVFIYLFSNNVNKDITFYFNTSSRMSKALLGQNILARKQNLTKTSHWSKEVNLFRLNSCKRIADFLLNNC